MSSTGNTTPGLRNSHSLTHSLTQTGKINQSINQSIADEARSQEIGKTIPRFKRPNNPLKQRCGEGEATIFIGIRVPANHEWKELRKIVGEKAARLGCSQSHIWREDVIRCEYPWENSKDSRLTEYPTRSQTERWPSSAPVDEGKNIHYLICRFCGNNFESSVAMPIPACPKCAKPEAPP
jgi:hypothetical protein